MTQEAKERRQPKPRAEEFSQLDPLRIGETLGWTNTSITKIGDATYWHFAGPISLSITRLTREGTIFGTADVMRIINGRCIVEASIHGISTIEFNKTQKEVVFRVDGRENPLIVKGSGQVDGTAVIHIAPPTN